MKDLSGNSGAAPSSGPRYVDDVDFTLWNGDALEVLRDRVRERERRSR